MRTINSLLKKYAQICWPISSEKALYLLLGLLTAGFFLLDTASHRVFLYIFLICGACTLKHSIKQVDFSEPLLRLTALFLGLHFISAGWSVNDDLEEYWKAIKIAPILLLMIIICLPLKEWPFVKIYIYTAALTAIILIVMNIESIWSQYITGENERIWRLEAYGRSANPNIAGALYAVAALIFLYSKTRFKWLCLMLVTMIVFLTLSRGALIALIGSLAITTLISNRRLILLLIPLAILPVIYPDIFQYMLERGTTGRTEIWSQAMTYLLQAPLFGHGAANSLAYEITAQGRTYNHTHNIYLATLNDTGLIGLTLLVCLLTLMLRRAYHLKNHALFAVITFGCIFGLVDLGGFYTSIGVEWVLFWFPLIFLLKHPIPQTKTDAPDTA